MGDRGNFMPVRAWRRYCLYESFKYGAASLGSRGCGSVIGLTVTAAAAIMFLKQKKESQDDFWEPEDYISCDWGKDTTVLHGTTLLRDRAPQVLFKSTVSGLCADLNISALRAISE